MTSYRFILFCLMFASNLGVLSQTRRALVYANDETLLPQIIGTLSKLVDYRQKPFCDAFEVINFNQWISHDEDKSIINTQLYKWENSGQPLPKVTQAQSEILSKLSDAIGSCDSYLRIKVLPKFPLVEYHFIITDSIPKELIEGQPIFLTEKSRYQGFIINLESPDFEDLLERKIKGLFSFTNHSPEIKIDLYAGLPATKLEEFRGRNFSNSLISPFSLNKFQLLSNKEFWISLNGSHDFEDSQDKLQFSFEQVNAVGGPSLPEDKLLIQSNGPYASLVGEKGIYYMKVSVSDGINRVDSIICIELRDPAIWKFQGSSNKEIAQRHGVDGFFKIKEYRIFSSQTSMFNTTANYKIPIDVQSMRCGVMFSITNTAERYIPFLPNRCFNSNDLMESGILSYVHSLNKPAIASRNDSLSKEFVLSDEWHINRYKRKMDILSQLVAIDSCTNTPMTDTLKFLTRIYRRGPFDLVMNGRVLYYTLDTFNYVKGRGVGIGLGGHLYPFSKFRIGYEFYYSPRMTIHNIHIAYKLFLAGAQLQRRRDLDRAYLTFPFGIDYLYKNRIGFRLTVSMNTHGKVKEGVEATLYYIIN